MAAGHPRLTFEMAAYFDNLPPHWNPNQDRRRHALNNPHQRPAEVRSAFEAKLWAIGQLAVAENSVELLKERAENPYKVWPEFTEYGCFACHHNLQPSNWRQERGFADRRPGGYPWGTWQFPVLAMVSPELAAGGPNPFLKENGLYEQLKTEMSRPLPNRKKVANLAEPDAGRVGQDRASIWIRCPFPSRKSYLSCTRWPVPKEVKSWPDRIGTPPPRCTWRRWRCIRAWSMPRAAHGNVSEQDQAIYEHFQAIRANLKFPEEKPDTGKPAIYNSPKTFEETCARSGGNDQEPVKRHQPSCEAII